MGKNILYILVIIGAVGVFAIYIFRQARPQEAPLHYTEMEYAPDKAVYAPGETMVFTPTLVVKQAGRVSVLRTFWDEGRDQSATLCDGSTAPVIEIARNLPAGTVGDIRGGIAARIEIPNLPPGDYLLLSSAVGPNGGQSVYEVRFKTERSC